MQEEIQIEIRALIDKYFIANSSNQLPVITETCGGIGCLSHILKGLSSKLTICELNTEHIKALKNNMELMGINEKDYNVVNKSYLEVFDKLEQDIIICDPPWEKTTEKLDF